MKPVFLNQDTRYGRTLLSIEDGHLCVATGRRPWRQEVRCRLEDIDLHFHRTRRRFIWSALTNLVTAIGLAALVYLVVERLKFIDDLMEGPFVTTWGCMWGGMIIAPLLWSSLVGFLEVDVVECRSKDGSFFVRLYQTKQQRPFVEEFLEELRKAILAASATTARS